MLAVSRRASSSPLLSARPLLCRALSSRTPSTPHDVVRPQPERGDFVSDAPGILSPQVRKQLNERMDQLQAEGRGEMAILLLENIRDSHALPGTAAYGKFTEEVFDHWGVGRHGINDGVVLAVFREGRRIEVRTGAGIMGELPNSWLASMQQRDMIPLFRGGDHEAGVERGANLILDRLEGRPRQDIQGEEVKTNQPALGSAATGELIFSSTRGDELAGGRRGGFGAGRVVAIAPGPTRYSDQTSTDGMLVKGTFFGIIGLVIWAESKAHKERERRKRLCLSCNQLTSTDCQKARDLAASDRPDAVIMVGVPSELPGRQTLEAGSRWRVGPDALTACELDERRLGASNFTLLRCPKCHGERVLREVGSIHYDECNGCRCRTVGRKTCTLVHATESHEGRVQVDTHCKHCNKRDAWQYTTPKLPPKQESSSSSGGGGFGGGSSSGGGGAGSSWLVKPEEGEEWWQIPPSEYVAHAAQHAIARARAAAGWEGEGVYGAPRRVEGQDGGQR